MAAVGRFHTVFHKIEPAPLSSSHSLTSTLGNALSMQCSEEENSSNIFFFFLSMDGENRVIYFFLG